MDFQSSEEQDMLRDSVRKMMDKVATPAYIRRLVQQQEFPYAVYDAWVEMGLLRLSFPEEYCGLGGSIIDLACCFPHVLGNRESGTNRGLD